MLKLPCTAPLYCLPTPSSFKLSFGQIRPFPRGADERVMVVSDLDGTMFGDVSHPEAFNSSYRFLEYWESGQVGLWGLDTQPKSGWGCLGEKMENMLLLSLSFERPSPFSMSTESGKA